MTSSPLQHINYNTKNHQLSSPQIPTYHDHRVVGLRRSITYRVCSLQPYSTARVHRPPPHPALIGCPVHRRGFDSQAEESESRRIELIQLPPRHITTPTMTASSFTSSTPSSSPSLSSFIITPVRRRSQQKKMSITQTYYLAHTARSKLTREAARADHDLRLLVGHANLLDSLMLELADAEQEQERWFNQTVSGAAKAAEEKSSKHIQWADSVMDEAIIEDTEEDWDPEDLSDLDSDSDDDSDYDEDEFVVDSATATAAPFYRAPSPVAIITEQEVDEDETDSDDDYSEEHETLTLTRASSRQSPPELSSDSEEESEDESMPPSPEAPTFDAFSEKEHQAVSALFDNKQPATAELPLSESPESDLFNPEYYVPAQDQGTMIEAY
ncbi:hypothetical protein DTO271G3_941 [Paecilomyces variotii]|nr:hypothetical protein DTO271G3_941 [Paecilomyces variotii]